MIFNKCLIPEPYKDSTWFLFDLFEHVPERRISSRLSRPISRSIPEPFRTCNSRADRRVIVSNIFELSQTGKRRRRERPRQNWGPSVLEDKKIHFYRNWCLSIGQSNISALNFIIDIFKIYFSLLNEFLSRAGFGNLSAHLGCILNTSQVRVLLKTGHKKAYKIKAIRLIKTA